MLKFIAAGVLLLVLVLWVRRSQSPPASALPPPFTPRAGVERDAAELPVASSGMRRFALAYAAEGHKARFEFSYHPKAPSGDSPFVITKGALEADTASDNTSLLAALARIHNGVPPTGRASRIRRIDLDVGVLGERLARQPGKHVIAGEFTDDNPGPWLVTKLFVPASDPDDEPAEVFLVLDPAGRHAEFLVKDEEYWPALGERLASVL